MEQTKFLIEALVRWADVNLHSLFVRHRGDTARGLILLVQELAESSIRIWVQETDDFGQRVFRRRFDTDISQQDAEGFIDRELKRDEDLWVLIMENSDGELPPVLAETIRRS